MLYCNKEKKTADAFTDSVLESKPEGLSLNCKTGNYEDDLLSLEIQIYCIIIFLSLYKLYRPSSPKLVVFLLPTDPIVNHKKTRCDTFIQEESQNKQIKRKHRMRDKVWKEWLTAQDICSSFSSDFCMADSMWFLLQMGNLICRDRAKNPKTRKAESPKKPKRDAAERLNRLVLKIRCLKIGTFTKIFRSCDTLTTQCMVVIFLRSY